MALKFRVNDKIIVTAGKDKGKTGLINKINRDKLTAVVEGVNVYKKHRKSLDPQRPSQIVEFSRALPFGNIAIVDPKTGKATRVRFITENGKKIRVSTKTGEKI